MRVGLVRSLQPPDILWIHWRVYNSTANTSKGGALLPPSDAYIRSFLYLIYTLIKLYYTHTHSHTKYHPLDRAVVITIRTSCLGLSAQRCLANRGKLESY